MEIEIVMRMEINTEDYNKAYENIRDYFHARTCIRYNGTKFENFYLMAAQPIEDLHDYDEEERKVGRPRKKRCSNNIIEPCNCAMH